jgi:hypothetical protein
MPIVIMPNGEMVDSVTGNPVNTPINRVPGMENNMGQFIANRPDQMGKVRVETELTRPGGMMGGTPDMLRRQIDPGRGMTMQQLQEIDPRSVVREGELTVMQKMQMLMDMGLTEGEAIDAIAMEESAGDVNPRAFSGRDIDPGSIVREGEMSGMGALGGVPMGGQVPMPMPRPRPQMPNDMGADRTMNPMDRITSRNAPST